MIAVLTAQLDVGRGVWKLPPGGLSTLAALATIDPHEIVGTTLGPDIEAARAWYKRSGELMDTSVAYYLKRLER